MDVQAGLSLHDLYMPYGWFLYSQGTCLLFACWVLLHAFLSSVDFFLKINFFKKSFRNTIKVSYSLDPDQAWQNFGPDLGPTPNCLRKVISRRQKLPLAGKCEVGIFDDISGIYIWYFWYIYTFYYFFMKTCCGYSLEVPWGGTSNEYTQHRFLWRNWENYLRSIIKYSSFTSPLIQPRLF